MKVFISYRRKDTEYVAGRIFESVASRFGKENVFMDVATIPLGKDFRKVIDDAVGQCDVLLALIGTMWLEIANAAGEPRIHDQGDFVRCEIESALQRGIPVIPVFIAGATIPADAKIPDSLKALPFHHGIAVRPDPDFHNDVKTLIGALEQTGKDDDSPVDVIRSSDYFEAHKLGNVVLLFLTDHRVDGDLCHKIAQEIIQLLDEHDCRKVIISMKRLDWLVSSIEAIWLRVGRHVKAQNGELRLCELSPIMFEIVKTQKLDRWLDIYDTRAEAMRNW